MPSFKAFRIHEENKKIVARFEQLTLDDLAAGDVVVRVTYSDINYKDALAATGAGKILRRYPLVGGIDFAGVVEKRRTAGTYVSAAGSPLARRERVKILTERIDALLAEARQLGIRTDEVIDLLRRRDEILDPSPEEV